MYRNSKPYPEVNKQTITSERTRLLKVYNIDPTSRDSEFKLELRTPDYIKEHFRDKGIEANIQLLRTDETDIRSYKARGAAAVILEAVESAHKHNLTVQKSGEGELITKIKIVADSEGNHAQGVAKSIATWNKLMGKARFKKIFGDTIQEISADIYMSGNADQTKVDNTKKLGGEHVTVLRAEGKAYDVARAAAEKRTEVLQEAGDASMKVVYVPPFNSQHTAKGAGTIGVDIDKLLGHEPDLVVCGIGGGGLSSGLQRYYDPKKVIPVATSYHPATIVGLIYGGEEISLRNTDRELSPIHVGGATILKGGDVTLKMLKHANTRVESAHPEQLAYLLNEYIQKELGYESFSAYKTARLNGDEKRKTPELAGFQSLAHIMNHPEILKDKKSVVAVITGGNISLDGSEIDIDEAINVKGHKSYPAHLPTAFYDPKDLVGSLKSVIGIVDDRIELDEIAAKGLGKKVQLTASLNNTLYDLTEKVIERIEKEVRLKSNQALQKNQLGELINEWAMEGRFNDEERKALVDRLKPQISKKVS